MKPPRYIDASIRLTLENRTFDDLYELIWLMEASRIAWKQVSELLLANEQADARLDLAIMWDGEIAAWKRR